MTKRTKRFFALMALGLSGTLLQLYTSGCGGIYANGLLTAFDASSVFNCDSSFFNLAPILIDCPDPAAAP